jgi:hypothetical protein
MFLSQFYVWNYRALRLRQISFFVLVPEIKKENLGKCMYIIGHFQIDQVPLANIL